MGNRVTRFFANRPENASSATTCETVALTVSAGGFDGRAVDASHLPRINNERLPETIGFVPYASHSLVGAHPGEGPKLSRLAAAGPLAEVLPELDKEYAYDDERHTNGHPSRDWLVPNAARQDCDQDDPDRCP